MPPDYDPLQGFESASTSEQKMAMIALAVRSIARSMREMNERNLDALEELANQVKWMQRTLVGSLVTLVVGVLIILVERGGPS